MNQDHDAQAWQHDGFWFTLSEQDRLHFTTEVRWGDGAKRCYLTYQQIHYYRKVSKCFEIAPGYRQVWTTVFSESESWQPIYIPMLEGHWTFIFKKWKFTNRNRVEYVIPQSRDNFWLFRSRARLFFPFTITRYNLTPFIDEEPFFKERLGFIQNRFSMGTKFCFSKTVSGHFFYMIRHLYTVNGWRRQNVFGNRLTFSF